MKRMGGLCPPQRHGAHSIPEEPTNSSSIPFRPLIIDEEKNKFNFLYLLNNKRIKEK